jgi:hypothetical protein
MARKTANFSRPADNTAYASGDAIANSGTGTAVVPLTFALDNPTGRIVGCSAVVTPESGNLVITALDFDVLIFRPVADIPFAAGSFIGDNAPMAITPAAMRELVGVFTFAAGAWRNQLGVLTAGTTGWQAVAPAGRTGYHFDTLGTNTLVAVVQAKGAWTPTGVVNRFDIALDMTFE